MSFDDSGRLPIIRLEVQSMKHSILVALEEHRVRLDKDIKMAIDSYCTQDNISAVIQEEINRAVAEEVQSFFRYGDGRKAVSAAVRSLSGGKNEL